MKTPPFKPCVDRHLPGEPWNPAPRIPQLEESIGREELVFAFRKAWEPGPRGIILKVELLDGSKKLKDMVIAFAKQWEEHASLKFDFGKHARSDIRVSFTLNDGHWSWVGNEAAGIKQSEPTMALDLVEDDGETEIRRVVLHEFGHAIGCEHEQGSPLVDIPWDKPAVYAYYAKPPNRWDEDDVDHNVFQRYKKRDVITTEHHDPDSIMQYPVPNELTLGVFEIGWNTELSENDKKLIAKLYP